MKKKMDLVLVIAAIALIGYHLTRLWFSSKSTFHQDELQHIHIAWNVLTGKIPLKDFFETHGPLSWALFSSALKFAPEPIASINSIFFLRKLCLFAVYANFILMFFCLKNLTKDTSLILLTLIIFIGGLTIQVTGFKIRPDIFVQSFFILALLFWLKRYRFLSGICLGVCLGFNPKFIVFNLAFLLADIFDIKAQSFFPSQNDLSETDTQKTPLVSALAGEMFALTGIAVALAYKGILASALNTLFLENITVSIQRYRDPYWHFLLFRSAVELDLFLLLVSFVCLLGLCWLFYKRKVHLESLSILLFFLTPTSFVFLMAPISHHSVLLIIPVFILLILYLLSKLFKTKGQTQCCLLIFGIIISYFSYKNLAKYTGKLDTDFEGLKKALEETQRSEPIFYYWPSRCPAYVFNEDHGNYWPNQFRTEKMKAGKPENRLANPGIKWVALGDELYYQLNVDEKNFLEQNFVKFNCLWKRK